MVFKKVENSRSYLSIILKVILSIVIVFQFSCQNEESEISQDVNNSLKADAPLYELVSRVAQNRTSQDNIIDNSSCYSIQLPVQVLVNGQQIDIITTADYQLVQDAFDASSTDDDVVYFTYPITVQLQDFQLVTINDLDELEELLEDCEEDENDSEEIYCIDFNYPIVINTFDTINQIASTVTIHNDSNLYMFLENLEDITLVSINYPISITDANAQNTIINSNEALESAIEEAIQECGNSANNGITLESVLIDGTWYVSYFFKNDNDETADFAAYILTFHSNGSLEIVDNSTSINGTWIINSNASERKLELELEGNTLIQLEEKWKVIEYSNTMVKLRLVGQGNGGNNYMYLSKN